MSAVPRTAVTQNSAGYRAHRPLHDNQREPARQHPPAPNAAHWLFVARKTLLELSLFTGGSAVPHQ